MTTQSHTYKPDDALKVASGCRKCGGTMHPGGKAIEQTYSAGSPDFPGDTHGMTISPGGPGKLIDCVKCSACGWSVSVSEIARSTPEGK